MRSPQELLLALGITLSEYSPGIYQTTCPKCSANRLKRHAKCLTVRIQPDKVFGGCNHCGWTFPEPGSGGKESRADVSYFIYRDRDGGERFRKAKTRDKKFWIERPDGEGGWVKGAAGIDTSIIYRANEIADVLREHPATLFAICEGEKDCDNLWRVGIPATCNAHGASEPGKRAKWTSKHSEQLRGARLCVIPDNDPAGHDHANAIIKCSTGIAMEVRQLVLKEHWPEIKLHDDVSDWLAAGNDFIKLIELLGRAPVLANGKAPEHSADPTDSEIERLARMNEFDLAKALKPTAKALGIRVIDMERLVKFKRASLNLIKSNLQGHALEYEEPEPWLEEIHIDHLLNELVRQVKRFIVLPLHAAEIIALWIVHTYAIAATDITPRLRIRAPERECGKSTLLDFLAELVYRPTPSSNVSTASLFRAVEKYHPTLLIDEADSFAREDNDVRNVLNSGHHMRGYVLRIEGDNRDVRRFTTFAPLAYAHLGDLPSVYATLVSRSIEIVLQRRLPHERIESMSNARRKNEFAELRRRLKRFVVDNVAELSKAQPAYPERVTNDRQCDNWRPLLAIADLGGNEWGERARRAIAMPKGTQSIRELLVADLMDMSQRSDLTGFDGFVYGAVVAEELNKLEDRPWSEWGRQRKPITAKAVAKLLSVFDISPSKNGSSTARGYYWKDLADLFERYKTEKKDPPPPENPAQVSNPLTTQRTYADSDVTGNPPENTHKSVDSSMTWTLGTNNSRTHVSGDDLSGFAEESKDLDKKDDDDVPFF